MKHLIILAFIVCSSVLVQAQQQAQIKKIAQQMADATVKGDFVTLARFTHPKVVAMMGGKEKMVAVVTQTLGQMKSEGITFEQATVGDPGKIITVGTEFYAVVPQSIVMKMKDKKISNTSSLLASSPDKGKTWYFTDAGGMTDAQIKQLFPGVLGKLSIPKRSQPVISN